VAARTKPASPGTGGHKTSDLGAHPAREQSVAAGKAARQLERVVAGQHLMQAVSDIFLGWQSATPPGRRSADF
jgi:hypothetical protein